MVLDSIVRRVQQPQCRWSGPTLLLPEQDVHASGQERNIMMSASRCGSSKKTEP